MQVSGDCVDCVYHMAHKYVFFQNDISADE